MSLLDSGTASRVARLIDTFADLGETIATAESLTGGLLASTLVNPAGASRVIVGGAITYQTDVKATILGVPDALLAERGAVDPEVALAMARGARAKFGATTGIATTGVAGPESQDGVSVGKVFIALVNNREETVSGFDFDGDRDSIRCESALAAITLLENSL